MKKKANAASRSQDIVSLILEDHKPLKILIKKMKSEKASPSERLAAFKEFAPLLTVHAKAEEQALYTYLKNDAELREEGFEAAIEHSLADEMIGRSRESSDDEQAAAIKVLAELVEHHIKEEEGTVLPDFKKEAAKETREEIGQSYVEFKNQMCEERLNDDETEVILRYDYQHLHV